MTIRVVHCGTGLTGREALRAIIEDPTLELVGQYVSTADKVGKDAGELCGVPPVGVRATGDLDELVGLRADCLCYASNAVGRESEAVEQMAQFLRAGTNVVTFAVVEVSYPPASPSHLRTTIASACEEGGSSLYASGAEPGAISMNLPAALLAMSGNVTGYREQQFALDLANMYPIESVLRDSMGFGQPDGYTPSRLADGTVETRWTPGIMFIGDLLGVEFDDVHLSWETACTPVDIETATVGTFAAGTISAYAWMLSGRVAGRPVVSVECFAQIVRDTKVPTHWPRLPAGIPAGVAFLVEGRPSYRSILAFEEIPGERLDASIPMTAMAVVNAIPAVVAAPTGHLSPTDLPFYATRRVG